MSIIKKMRKQKAVWWARLETPDQYGAYSFAAPVEIDCRWDDSGTEFRNGVGQTEMSSATVYPDRVLHKGDKLKKGELESDTPDSPLDLLLAFEIQRFDETPNLKNTETLYTAYL